MVIFIDPRSRVSYASYYIEGLYQIFGKENVRFQFSWFKDLIQKNGLDDFDQYFAFVVKGNKILRIVIDYRDKSTINLSALTWCNIYGKVNYNIGSIDNGEVNSLKKKIIPIGPNFGIKIWKFYEIYFRLLMNYIRSFKTIPVSFRTFAAGYNWMNNRENIDTYKPGKSSDNYIFLFLHYTKILQIIT